MCVREILSSVEMDTGKESQNNNSISKFSELLQCLQVVTPLKHRCFILCYVISTLHLVGTQQILF